MPPILNQIVDVRSAAMRVFFVGATGQAKLCRIFLEDQGHTVPIVFDRSTSVPKPFECELFHDPDLIEAKARECDAFLACVGGQYGETRADYSNRLLATGLFPISCIHPAAFIGRTVKRGRGLQIMPQAAVSEMTTLGDWCILNTNCTVDHECRIGHGVHIMGGASIAGMVEIGDFATIGTNATVLPRLKIGKGAFVGAGAVVTKDVPPGAIVAGVPARALLNAVNLDGAAGQVARQSQDLKTVDYGGDVPIVPDRHPPDASPRKQVSGIS